MLVWEGRRLLIHPLVGCEGAEQGRQFWELREAVPMHVHYQLNVGRCVNLGIADHCLRTKESGDADLALEYPEDHTEVLAFVGTCRIEEHVHRRCPVRRALGFIAIDMMSPHAISVSDLLRRGVNLVAGRGIRLDRQSARQVPQDGTGMPDFNIALGEERQLAQHGLVLAHVELWRARLADLGDIGDGCVRREIAEGVGDALLAAALRGPVVQRDRLH